MRLTLRTLLAYLDDVLDPAHAKEIGQKIQESPVALKTIERIKEVTRKRRINAPAVDNKTLDPNTTGEYLDNTLDPANIAEIEKICLEDDEYLAEVAACHQILTLVLGEPVEIPPNTRERMYLLEHNNGQPQAVTNQPASASTSTAAKNTPEKTVSPVTKTSTNEVPEYLKRESFLQRYWPLLLMIGLGAGWLYVIFTDDTFRQNNSVAQNDLNPDKQDTLPGVNKPVDDSKTKDSSSSGALSTAAAAMPATTADNKSPPVMVPAVPVENTAGNLNTSSTVVDNSTPGMNTPAKPGNETMKPAPVDNTNPPPLTTLQMPMAPVFYRFNQDLLICQKILGDDWFVVSPDQQLSVDELLACPKPFRALLEFPQWNLKIEMDGGSVIQFMSPTPDRDFGLEIKRGRILLSNLKPDLDLNAAVKIDLVVGSNSWRISMSPGKLLAGVDVIPRLPTHLEENFGNQTHHVTLRTEQGKLSIIMPDATIQSMLDQQTVVLAKLNEIVPRLKDLNNIPLSSLNTTDWMKENDNLKTVVQKRNAKEFLEGVDAGPADAPLPVWLSISPIATGSNPKSAEFAAQTLALKTWKKGDRAEVLINCIARAEHDEARKAALDGLREWLPTSPDNKDILRSELVKIFPEETSLILYQLLWGYNDQDIANLETSQKLLDWLLHEDINVRVLAIYHIERITGNKNNYKPLEPANLRESVVRRWKLQVEKDGGLIPEQK